VLATVGIFKADRRLLILIISLGFLPGRKEKTYEDDKRKQTN